MPIDRPLRVCFMLERLFPAGVELQLLLLLKWLDRSRITPSVCLLDGTDEVSRSLEPRDCPVDSSRRPPLAALLGTSLAACRLARFFRLNESTFSMLSFPTASISARR